MKRQYHFWLVLLALFHAFIVTAQQYDFHFISNKDGLPQNTVWDIFQDSKGYIWFGTDGGGVCKYDGSKFLVYTKSEGLASNIVRKIAEDKQGNICLCTDAGLSIFDGKKFTNVNVKTGLSNDLVMCVLPNDSSSYWVGTSGGGLNLVILKNNKITCKTFSTNQLLGSDYIFDLYKDKRNRLWLATFGGGLNILNFKGDSLVSIKYLTKNQSYPSDKCYSFFSEDEQTLWCNTYDNGVFRIGLSSESDQFVISTVNKDNGLLDNTVWSSVIHNGSLVIGTNSAGVAIYDKGTIMPLTVENGLQSNQIVKVFSDKEHNLWFSVFGKGVCRFTGLHFYQYGKNEGYKNDNITAIQRWGDTVIVASDGGGVYFHNLKTKRITNFSEANGLPDSKVTGISFYKKDPVLSTNKGIAVYHNHSWHTLKGSEGYLITTILGTGDGYLWFGTDMGLYRYDGKAYFLIDQKLNLPNNYIQYLQEINGVLWVATLDGLASIKGNQITTYDQQDGLDYKKINTLFPYKKDELLIGTAGNGLYVYNSHAKKNVKQLKSSIPFLSKIIKSISKISDDEFLIGADNGCIVVQIRNDSLYVEKQFTKDNGFIGIESNVNALSKIGDTYWIGTVNGITVYAPKKELKSHWNPLLHLTDVKLFFKHINWQDRKLKTPKWFNTPADLELSYKENHISISYQALGFATNNVYYKYKLDGLDETWSPPRYETEAVYPSLAPGVYTFKVKAVNAVTLEESKPISYTFTIVPPFWQTWWFYTIVTIIVLVSFYSFVKIREVQLKRDKERLEKIVQIRTKEVQDQAEIIQHKNKEITDSIRYSKRIQSVILPNHEYINKHLSEYFILFKPKDIVSGDFYWFAAVDDKLIVTVADCTGHGVPGAFMSMLGMSFLSEVVIKKGITRPDLILNAMRQNIIVALKQDQFGTEQQKDGMDMSLVTLDLKAMTLQHAGAHNPLVLISDGEMIEYKADKMPVGIFIKNDDFSLNERQLKHGDCIYMFSDGYVDQFGGPKNKKFMSKNLKELFVQIHTLPMTEQKEILDKSITDWMAHINEDGEPYQQTDDICVWGVKF